MNAHDQLLRLSTLTEPHLLVPNKRSLVQSLGCSTIDIFDVPLRYRHTPLAAIIVNLAELST